MGMNSAELERVVASLQGVVGSHFGNVWQPARDRVVLGLSDGTFLLLAPRGPLARFHSLTRRPRNPPRPFSFQGVCRARLHGPLTALFKDPVDRVVHLRFGQHELVLRLTGRSGGLWLLDQETVIAAYDGPAPESLPELPGLVPRDDAPRFTPAEGESWDDAARVWFSRAESAARLADRRARVRRDLKRARDRARRLQDHLADDLDRASQAPLLRKQADVLAANLHQVERGASRVSFPDWEDPDAEVYIELDPSKPAVATMEVLYSRARRLDRVGDRVLERMDEVEQQLAALDEALATVDAADGPALAAMEKLVPRQVRRGDDYWLHLRGRPGAHLVLPMKGGRTPPLELLLAAAQIALVAGKVVEGQSADVQYTRVRHVRAVPGETALVRVAEEKVLHVKRDPAVLVGWARD